VAFITYGISLHLVTLTGKRLLAVVIHGASAGCATLINSSAKVNCDKKKITRTRSDPFKQNLLILENFFLNIFFLLNLNFSFGVNIESRFFSLPLSSQPVPFF
jgi:hypothetical protein